MSDYQPVSCDFHDQLEAIATLHQPCDISYRQTDDGKVIDIRDRIVDVYTTHEAEMLKLADGTTIRLDQIVALNGKSRKDYAVGDY